MKLNYICISCILVSFLLSATLLDLNAQEIKPEHDSTLVKRILPAHLIMGKELDSIPSQKFEAALNLAAKLSQKYEIISMRERDSTMKSLEKLGIYPEAYNLAKALKCDYILFGNLNAVNNMLRADVALIAVADTNAKTYGKGYAPLKLRNQENNKPIYDPAILTALQRALALATGDSLLFEKAPGGLSVHPAAALVVGGLFYSDDGVSTEWKIFKEKEVSSYFAVESIFEVAKDSPDYAVYDTETRDSIYAMFNMYSVENYNYPTLREIQALNAFDVDNYIAGKFTRVAEGARLELSLFNVLKSKLEKIKTVSGILSTDNREDYGKLIRKLTRKLLEKKPEETKNR